MSGKSLTDTAVRNLKPKNRNYRVLDRDGLYIQVTPAGSRKFEWRYTSPNTGQRRYYPLGDYPAVKLADARAALPDLRHEVSQGLDPRDRLAKGKIERASSGSVDALFSDYLDKLRSEGVRSYEERKRLYAKEIQPAIGSIKACDIEPEHIKQIVTVVYKRSPSVATHVREILHAAFSYGMKADYDVTKASESVYRLKYNPVAPIKKPTKPNPLVRNLTANEIQTLWNALNHLHPYTAAVVKLRLLLGCRLQELTGMRWDELNEDEDLWTIPAGRSKNKRENTLPLTDTAVNILSDMRILSQGSHFVFPHRDDQSKPMAWRSVTQAVDRLCKKENIERFTPRDLRRTFKTRATDLGLGRDILNAIQNHGTTDGVDMRHYNQSQQVEQKRIALEAWEKWLLATVQGNQRISNNVIPLQG